MTRSSLAAVHQFVPSFVDHDAISSHVRHLERVFRNMGLESEVWAGEWRGNRSRARSFRHFSSTAPTESTTLLYHLSTASPIAGWLADRPERIAVNYHNITPVDFLEPWEPGVAPELLVARNQLADLAHRTSSGIGVSRYNEAELRSAGYSNTAVAPILFDADEFARNVDREVDERLCREKQQGGVDWLFVGRITPHKRQHELVQALAVHRRLYDPHARLRLVGGSSSHRYLTALGNLIAALGLGNAVELAGSVSNDALGAYYARADAFVCVSAHEGFGVPLLEALHHGVPVVAQATSAIGETLGSGGLLLAEVSSATVAAAANRVVTDQRVRSALVQAGKRRLADFTLDRSEERWRSVITDVVASR